ncbi:MAG: helix-turn-helix transcriptional regulator [Gammaproteobacteria bacterium]|nr:helix-turn-helix transcriptional regulator [Gammaproteobacteria bacterium]
MANIASVLKAEIARVARKEVRAEIEGLKKASTQYRSAIAELRREVASLQKQMKQAGREHAAGGSSEKATSERKPRFSATRLAAHRAKLGLSAADYGSLLGMSGATIYLWERGKTRPRPAQLQQVAELRAMGRRAIKSRLEELKGSEAPASE